MGEARNNRGDAGLRPQVRASVFGGYATEAASRTRADREARNVACGHIRGYRVDNDISTAAIDWVNAKSL